MFSGFRDKAGNQVLGLFMWMNERRARRRQERIRQLQEGQAGGSGKTTKIILWEGNKHLRDQMPIPHNVIVLKGRGGKWDRLPADTKADTVLHMDWVVMKGIITGRCVVPMTNGETKVYGPGTPEGTFTASTAIAYDLVEPEPQGGKTGILKNALIFDKEMESMLNSLRIIDDRGNLMPE